MNSAEIISNIHSVYSKFDLPSNLRMHCFRTAAIAELICDNWNGPAINKNDIVAALLLHDLGNLIKYDFSHQNLLSQEDAGKIDYWRQRQKETIEKYGSSETEATMKMVCELAVEARLKSLLAGHESLDDWNAAVLGGNDWDNKIISYADCRVSPFGVVTIEERFKDLITRRKGKPVEQVYRALFPSVIELEAQLSQKMSISPSQITDKTIESYMGKYNKD
jgi:hypothetical protein